MNLPIAKLKLAEMLYYEGKNVKEINRATGLSERNIRYYIYSSKTPWKQTKEEIEKHKTEQVLALLNDTTTNYARVLEKASKDLMEQVLHKGKELKIHEHKTVSSIVVDQVRTQALTKKDETPQNQTNIQINLSPEEAEDVLKNDPASLNPLEIPPETPTGNKSEPA